jgi:hypothetical protein
LVILARASKLLIIALLLAASCNSEDPEPGASRFAEICKRACRTIEELECNEFTLDACEIDCQSPPDLTPADFSECVPEFAAYQRCATAEARGLWDWECEELHRVSQLSLSSLASPPMRARSRREALRSASTPTTVPDCLSLGHASLPGVVKYGA